MLSIYDPIEDQHGSVPTPSPVVRASNDREQRLTDYIRGHTGADITVWLSAAVETAFVVPRTETALVEADQCDLARQLSPRSTSATEIENQYAEFSEEIEVAFSVQDSS